MLTNHNTGDICRACKEEENEDIYTYACNDENCECRSSTQWPDNIRHGCLSSIKEK